MAVFDGAPWVGAAVESLLTQTLADLEVIVIDDGSTDPTPEVLAALRDPRLRVERRPRAGLTRSLIRALELARAPLLARLDADDLALPERLARQRQFLDAHPDVGLLGTAAREVDVTGREVAIVRPPVDDAAIRRALIRANPFVHSSVIMRRAALDRAGGYDHAPGARHTPGEPARAPRDPAARPRTRLGRPRRRPAPGRGAGALASRAEPRLPLVVRRLRPSATRGARPARSLAARASRANAYGRLAVPGVVLWPRCEF